MNSTHRHYPKFGAGKNSFAYLSVREPKKLVLFVHGFGGSAEKTWAEFPQMLKDQLKARECDIVSWGYDSIMDTPLGNADMLIEVIDACCVSPRAVIDHRLLNDLGRRLTGTYERVIIVAHSIGAIIARLAVLRGLRKRKSWGDITEFFFFAPAHGGARAAHTAKEILATAEFGFEFVQIGFGKAVSEGVNYYAPILDSLTGKTNLLADLKSDTLAAINSGKQNLVARMTIFGSRERVVFDTEFIAQEPIETTGYGGKNHFEVCKPRGYSFEKPLHDLVSIL